METIEETLVPRRPRAFLVPVIISLNVVVFLMWNTSFVSEYFMAENFLISWDNLVLGRYWDLLTSVFSHIAIWHIFVNMYVLFSFGSVLEEILGSKRFLMFYLVAGIVSSFFHAFISAYLLHSPDLPALGASGAIAGVVLVFSLMFPKQKILLFGIVPIPAMWGALAFIGFDLWGLFAQAGGGGLPIGHGAHLGGAFTGILFYFLFIRRFRQRMVV